MWCMILIEGKRFKIRSEQHNNFISTRSRLFFILALTKQLFTKGSGIRRTKESAGLSPRRAKPTTFRLQWTWGPLILLWSSDRMVAKLIRVIHKIHWINAARALSNSSFVYKLINSLKPRQLSNFQFFNVGPILFLFYVLLHGSWFR